MSGNGRDDVDWNQLGLSPDQVAEALARELKAKRPAEFKRSTQPYTKFPNAWEERLTATKIRSTYRVALYLLHRHWRTGKDRIALPNKALSLRGVSPRSKWRALAELEAAGLVMVENRNRKAPIVYLLQV